MQNTFSQPTLAAARRLRLIAYAAVGTAAVHHAATIVLSVWIHFSR